MSVRWGMPSSLGLGLGLLLAQLSLEHLAGGVARELVDELDVARDLVAGEVGLDVLLDLVLGEVRAVLLDDDRLQPLAELLVVDAEDGRLPDALVAGEQVLDLLREHVLAARDDHVVVAAVHEQAPALVEVADVAGAHQTLDDVLVAATRVALELHLVADEDAAGLPLPDGLAVVV